MRMASKLYSPCPMPDRPALESEAVLPFLPYGKQEICDDDIKAVVQALRSDWLTTGPRVQQFESAFANWCGAQEGVAVNSGTAALHAAMRAIRLKPGEEVIVPAITFAATANAAIYEGGVPVFADVEEDTLLIDPVSVASKVTPKTRAIIAVDYAGQPADYDALLALARGQNIALIADACHSPGATYKGRNTGTLADISCFSFHPVKHLTTCEGGMAVTDDSDIAAQMRRFRNHGIGSDHRAREKSGTHVYDMSELGYNYRLPDVQCALGLAQLSRLACWVTARQRIAGWYDKAFERVAQVTPLTNHNDRTHAYHIYVVRLDQSIDRDKVFAELRAKRIGANVHYAPVYRHSYYERRGYGAGIAPIAEAASNHLLTLPMYPTMTIDDVHRVVAVLGKATA